MDSKPTREKPGGFFVEFCIGEDVMGNTSTTETGWVSPEGGPSVVTWPVEPDINVDSIRIDIPNSVLIIAIKRDKSRRGRG